MNSVKGNLMMGFSFHPPIYEFVSATLAWKGCAKTASTSIRYKGCLLF
jgi:hypothetical protein